MPQFNPYLRREVRAEAKGGAQTIEDPKSVGNIVFQTRGGELDAFEDRLAGELMTVFGGGAEALGDVVAGLNVTGSRDRDGAAWTERSFTDQMAASASALFAVSEGSAG